MAFLKIVIKDSTNFETHLIDLSDIRDVICKFPLPDEEATEKDKDDYTTKEAHEEEEVKIQFKDNNDFEIKLEETPAVFTVYDDYGTEITKTDDLEVLMDSIMDAKSNEPEFVEPDDKDIPTHIGMG